MYHGAIVVIGRATRTVFIGERAENLARGKTRPLLPTKTCPVEPRDVCEGYTRRRSIDLLYHSFSVQITGSAQPRKLRRSTDCRAIPPDTRPWLQLMSSRDSSAGTGSPMEKVPCHQTNTHAVEPINPARKTRRQSCDALDT